MYVSDANLSIEYTWDANTLDASIIKQITDAEDKDGNSGLVGTGRTLNQNFKTLKTG